MELKQKIKALKEQKDVIILAHYYTEPSVQEVADFVGDSYYLSKVGQEAKEQTILFCGVHFMGESAKILSPQKRIVVADEKADCPMAHRITAEDIAKMRAQYEDLAVVCYINSTAEIKALSDICVTSSNAVDIVRKLKQKHIFFVPDQHLGRFVAAQVPEKDVILHSGFCDIHHAMTPEAVRQVKEKHPEAEIVVHPECPQEIVNMGDYVGSTSGILEYARKSSKTDFIVCTEAGIMHALQTQNPNKHFHTLETVPICADMKRITLEKIHKALTTLTPTIEIDEALRVKAKDALLAMHQFGN